MELRINDGADIFLIKCGEVFFTIGVVLQAPTILARIRAKLWLVGTYKRREHWHRRRFRLVLSVLAWRRAQCFPQPSVGCIEIDIKSRADVSPERPAFGIIIDAAVVTRMRVKRDRRAVVRGGSDLQVA